MAARKQQRLASRPASGSCFRNDPACFRTADLAIPDLATTCQNRNSAPSTAGRDSTQTRDTCAGASPGAGGAYGSIAKPTCCASDSTTNDFATNTSSSNTCTCGHCSAFRCATCCWSARCNHTSCCCACSNAACSGFAYTELACTSGATRACTAATRCPACCTGSADSQSRSGQ